MMTVAASQAWGQTAVERNLPPAPAPTTAPIIVDDALPVSQDGTPLGGTLRAIVLIGRDGAVDAAAVADGVDARDVPLLDRGSVRAGLRRLLGQPLSRKLIAEVQAEIARQARALGHPFVSLSTPEQELTDGVLRIRVTEFRVGEVTVKGVEGDRAAVIRRQARIAPDQPVSSRMLAEDLDWINRNPFVEARAQFTPAARPGDTDLALAVTRTPPVRVYAGWSNTGSQSTGLDRYFVGGIVELPVLRGAYASYQLTGSRDFWIDDDTFFPSGARYRAQGGRVYVPLAPRQNLEFTFSDALTNQVANADFTVRQRATEGTLGYRTALSNLGLKAGSGDLLLGIEGKRQHRTVFFGEKPALDVSADIWQVLVGWSKGWLGNGRAASASLNLHVSPGGLSDRSSSARLNDLTNGRIGSNRYAYGTLDLSGQMRLPHGFAMNSSLSGQYTGKAIPLSAQIGLGGDSLVRGYTPDDGSFDLGVVARNELRVPPLAILGRNRDQLSPYLFVDAGYGRDRALGTDSTVASAGFGSDYRIGRHFSTGFSSAWALVDGQRTRSGDWRLQARATVTF